MQNVGEIMAATVHQTIFCSGIDSAAKAKAWSDIIKFRESFKSLVSMEQLQAVHWYKITDVLVSPRFQRCVVHFRKH